MCPLQSGVDLSNVKMSMNPFCEIAVEVGAHTQASELWSTSARVGLAVEVQQGLPLLAPRLNRLTSNDQQSRMCQQSSR